MNNNAKRHSTFWWLFAISGSIAGSGFAGLLLGLFLFPHSNLLGGFGLLFGPLWWFGAPLFGLVTVFWIITRLYGLLKRK